MKNHLLLVYFCSMLMGYAQTPFSTIRELEEGGHFTEAYALLVEHAKEVPCAPCNAELAELAYKSGYMKECIQHTEEALVIDSSSVQLWYRLTKAYEKRGNFKAAYNAAMQLVALAGHLSTYRKIAATLAVQNRQYSAAIQAYMEALKLSPTDEEAGYSLSKLLYALELYPQAENIALQFMAIDSTHPGFLALLPKVYYQLKEYQKAKIWGYHFLARHDTTPDIAKIMATSAVHTESYDSAFAFFEYLGRQNEMSEGTYFYKAYAFEQSGKRDSAQFNYARAIEMAESPNMGQYRLRLAMVLDASESYPEAIEQYKKAYAHTKNEEILYYLARAYDRYYQDKTVAMDYYERYLKESDTVTNPTKEYASARISQIKEVMHLKLDSL